MIATLKNKREIAANTLLFELDLEQEIIFRAGQFFFSKLIDPTIDKTSDSTRHFSFVNPPEDNKIIEFATRLSGSNFKQKLNNLKIGSPIEITGPAGKFILPTKKSELIMIAGGIGITPFISQLRHIQNKQLDYKIKLLHFNTNQTTAPFYDLLQNLNQVLKNFSFVPIMSDNKNWSGETGYINQNIIKKYSQHFSEPFFLVVGPPPMIKNTLLALQELAVPESHILTEEFTGYTNY